MGTEPPCRQEQRRDFLLQFLRPAGVSAGLAGAAWWLKGRGRRPAEPALFAGRPDRTVPRAAGLADMAVVRGAAPRELVRRAFQELGGVHRFVSPGDVVALKPNMAWDRTPAQAANTNPEVVAEVARLCLQAGAARVLVSDVPVNEPRQVFERSGIAEAARREGAEIVLPEPRRFQPVDLGGETLGRWPVLEPFLTATKLINIPIAKHHSLTGVTLGMKNWYGVLGGARSRLHQRIHESLADLAAWFRPTLTMLDACRVLLRNGPSGGSLADIAEKQTVIAGIDPVALDAYAAQAFWGLSLDRLHYLKLAAARGLGRTDFENLSTRVVAL